MEVLRMDKIVIASEARHSSVACSTLDCRVAALLAMTVAGVVL